MTWDGTPWCLWWRCRPRPPPATHFQYKINKFSSDINISHQDSQDNFLRNIKHKVCTYKRFCDLLYYVVCCLLQKVKDLQKKWIICDQFNIKSSHVKLTFAGLLVFCWSSGLTWEDLQLVVSGRWDPAGSDVFHNFSKVEGDVGTLLRSCKGPLRIVPSRYSHLLSGVLSPCLLESLHRSHSPQFGHLWLPQQSPSWPALCVWEGREGVSKRVTSLLFPYRTCREPSRLHKLHQLSVSVFCLSSGSVASPWISFSRVSSYHQLASRYTKINENFYENQHRDVFPTSKRDSILSPVLWPSMSSELLTVLTFFSPWLFLNGDLVWGVRSKVWGVRS